MERRKFLKTACAACGVAAIPGLLNSCSKTSTAAPAANFTIDLSSATYSALQSPGGSQVVNGVIIVSTGTSTYVAFSSICTHQGCVVSYYKAYNEFICPCHGGTYDINGNVVAGPPPSALTKYTVTLTGTSLTIKS